MALFLFQFNRSSAVLAFTCQRILDTVPRRFLIPPENPGDRACFCEPKFAKDDEKKPEFITHRVWTEKTDNAAEFHHLYLKTNTQTERIC